MKNCVAQLTASGIRDRAPLTFTWKVRPVYCSEDDAVSSEIRYREPMVERIKDLREV